MCLLFYSIQEKFVITFPNPVITSQSVIFKDRTIENYVLIEMYLKIIINYRNYYRLASVSRIRNTTCQFLKLFQGSNYTLYV